jgi:hypothetical protein
MEVMLHAVCDRPQDAGAVVIGNALEHAEQHRQRRFPGAGHP